ncbi:hypothetical protein ACFQ1E_02920 [Sphingomonas canadensis]|uniref:Argininosuccinate lyase n=1 Tax=Sphingomonas canadensis TaxID=1219257 RepID=A0ABW3H4M1_9SPHN|nr:hypothetical protein [Sphingomonas canadensis]MCW3834805.1 hypothetical protein [Sphingomonas canadensis]
MRAVLVALAALSLGGCGAREDLAPAPGQSLPVKPTAARATPSPEQLLEPAPQTRPARSGDLIESSKERRSDEFDLPPPN